MKVWLFTMSQRIADAENTRTFLLARHLRQRGCEVTLWTSAFDHIVKKFRRTHGQEEVLPNGVRAIYISGGGYKTNVSVRRYFDHWLVGQRFGKLADQQSKPDVAVVSIPDHLLATAAVSYLRRHGIPVVVDVRDQWPDIFLDVIRNPFIRLAARSLLWRDRALISKTIGSADSAVSMMDALLQWGQKLGRRTDTSRDRMFYLATMARLPRQLPIENATPPIQALLRSLGGKPFHFFVGTFGVYYNPLLLIEAAKKLQARSSPHPFPIVIGGSGTNFEEVKAAARDLPHVHLTGWLDKNDSDVLVSHAATGIIPCSTKIDAFPNKSFTYLSAGLPILSSVDGDLKQAIEQRGIGLCFPPGDAAGLADQMAKIEQDQELRKQLGLNAAHFFEEKLDSDETYSAYSAHVLGLIRPRPSS
jgi:glycosyltransferase involved in cell wall biosynthesis